MPKTIKINKLTQNDKFCVALSDDEGIAESGM